MGVDDNIFALVPQWGVEAYPNFTFDQMLVFASKIRIRVGYQTH